MRIYSFSYKMNGEDQFATTGENAPLILDCRGITNPHSDPVLRRMTGKDKPVQDMVMTSRRARQMLTDAHNYLLEDPRRTVAFGCSYGKHRSVALAELLKERLPHAVVIHTGAVVMGRNT